MGVIIPKSRQGNSVAPVVGLPQLQAEDSGMAPAVAGLRQATADLTSVADRVKRQEDEIITTDALNVAVRREQNAYYSSDGGLLQRRGMNALEGDGRKNVLDEGLERRQEILDETLVTLRSPRQRAALKSAWAARDRFAIDTLQRHMDREREVYRDSVDETFIATEQEALTLAPTDLERSVHVAQIATKVQEIAERKGLSPEATDVMVREFTTAPLENSIAQMARTDPAGAEALFEAKKPWIKADRHAAITGRLEMEGVTIQSQDLTEAAFASNPGGSLAQVQRWIRANSTGKVEDDALGRASSRWQVEDRARRDGAEGASNGLDAGIWRFVGQPSSARTPQATQSFRDELVRSIQDQNLDVAAGTSLLRNFDTLTAGKTVETDAVSWGQLWNIRTKDPKTFAEMDLAGWRDKFAREDFNELQSEQKDIRAGGSGSATSPSGLGALEVAKKVAIDAGIEGKEWEAEFELRAHRAIQAQQEQLGRSLNFKEREQAAVDVLNTIPVPSTGWFWTEGEKRIGELKAADRKAIVAAPPTDLVQRAKAALGPGADDELIADWIDEWLALQGVPGGD